MVAHYGGMESHLVHQCHHRIGWNLKHVVDGVTRTVVACGENQQVGIERTQRVGHEAEPRELLDGSMRVVDRQDVNLLAVLCRNRQGDEHQQR